MASKFAWIIGKRGLLLALAAVVAAVFGHSGGLWDGPA